MDADESGCSGYEDRLFLVRRVWKRLLRDGGAGAFALVRVGSAVIHQLRD
jgi:hypothetical protein